MLSNWPCTLCTIWIVCDMAVAKIAETFPFTQFLIGTSVYLALPLFYAITGCEVIPYFLVCEKKTARVALENTPGQIDML